MSRHVDVTMHAVDRASSRIWPMFERARTEQSDPEFGIVAWLRRYAAEAWSHGLRIPRGVSTPGLSHRERQAKCTRAVLDGRVLLVFAVEGATPRLLTVMELAESQARSLRVGAALAPRAGVNGTKESAA